MEISEKKFIPDDLPIVIHGKEGSGASYFSIQLIAQIAKNKNPLTFWSAYPMAKDEFRKTLGKSINSDITVLENGNPEEIVATLKKINEEEILFVKNFEIIPKKMQEKILNRKLLVVSGDMETVLTKSQILNFPTRIFFSPHPEVEIPALKKYQGYMFSKYEQGTVQLGEKNEIIIAV